MATLTPIPSQAAQSAATPFLCLACGDAGGADLLSNIVLFLPLGLALAALGVPWRTATALGLLLSGFVEGMQYSLIAGRDAALGDLVANTAGTAIGTVLMANARRLLHPAPGAARRLWLGWAALVVATLGFTRWALKPDLPDGPWYGQWNVGAPEPEFFLGRVLEVRLGGTAVPHWRLPDELQHHLQGQSGETVLLETTILSGEGAPDPRRILSMATDRVRFLSLGTGDGDLSCAIRTRSARLRLLSPRFRLKGGMPAAAGDTVAIRCSYGPGGRAELHSGRALGRSENFRLGPLDPWVFLWPGPVPAGPLLWLARLGTIGVLLGPLWLWRDGLVAGPVRRPPGSREPGGAGRTAGSSG